MKKREKYRKRKREKEKEKQKEGDREKESQRAVEVTNERDIARTERKESCSCLMTTLYIRVFLG